MKSFKTYINEATRQDLNTKYQGISTTELMKRAKDNRKYSPSDRAAMKKEIEDRSNVREGLDEAVSFKREKSKEIDPYGGIRLVKTLSTKMKYNDFLKIGKSLKSSDKMFMDDWGNGQYISLHSKTHRHQMFLRFSGNKVDFVMEFDDGPDVKMVTERAYKEFEKYFLSNQVNEETSWPTRKGKWANSYKGGFNSKEDADKHYNLEKAKRKSTKVSLSRLKPTNEEAPAMNTTAVPGAGSDNSLSLKKARMFKKIYRRFDTKKETVQKIGFKEAYQAPEPRFTGNKIPKKLLDALPRYVRPLVNGYDFTDKGIVISFTKPMARPALKEIESALGSDWSENGYDKVDKYHSYHFRDYGSGY